MAKPWVHRSGSLRCMPPAWQLLFLLTAQTGSVLAQNLDSTPAAASDIPILIPVDPENGDSPIAAASSAALSSALPSSTDDANYATHNSSSSSSSNHGILNYYFLLLAVVVVAIALGYWFLARRRRRRINALRNNQQSALTRDLETWPRQRRAGGWRHADADNASPEEGLDARGEAPPAYVKEPAQAHVEGGDDVELRDLDSGEGKPPEYESGPAR